MPAADAAGDDVAQAAKRPMAGLECDFTPPPSSGGHSFSSRVSRAASRRTLATAGGSCDDAGPASAPPDTTAATGARRGTRLHHLDWLRSMMIALAVYLHVWQAMTHRSYGVRVDNAAFPKFDLNSSEYRELGQDRPDYVRNSHEWRYVMLGRQFCIPLLFFVNGASLALSGGETVSLLKKVGGITLVGMACNALLWLIGPMNDECELTLAQSMEACSGGVLINWVVAPHGGAFFAVLFQFWFTLFLIIFLAEDALLFTALRDLHQETCDRGLAAESVRPSVRLLGMRLGSIAVFILGLSLWAPAGTSLPGNAVYVMIMEVVFTACLARGATTLHPTSVRLWQYAAAGCTIFQFCLPDFQPTSGFDGRIVIYFHIFKQMLALGFLMSLTRQNAGPIFSRIWPLAILLLILGCPSTNFFSAGMSSYPWFPFVVDRVLYSSGTLAMIFMLDRLGRVFGEQLDLCQPLPRSVGFGTLLAYVFHPVVLVVLMEVPVLRESNPVVVAAVTLLIFIGIAKTATFSRASPSSRAIAERGNDVVDGGGVA